MARKVKCYFCEKIFDRDKEPFVQVKSRRYAHQACAEGVTEERNQEEKDLDDLENYIKKLFNTTYISATIRKQIKDYRQQYNFTYSGILKTLIYWYEVKRNSLEKANHHIGIVPYIYNQACDYYYYLYKAEMINKDKDILSYTPRIKKIKITPPKSKKREIKLFNLGEEEMGNE